jgi:hypothetical protein
MRTRHVAWIKEIRTTYEILVGKYEGKTSLMRPGPTWEKNIKINLQEIV